MPPKTTLERRLALRPDLQAQLIHLWVADLDNAVTNQPGEIQFLRELEFLAALLPAVECERAERYHFEIDRQRFIARRGLLHILLGAYLDIPPEQVKLTSNSFGKPSIDVTALPPASNSLAPRLRFNLSHSAGMALFAFALDHEVGVDIEWMRQDFEFLPIAQRFFSPLEQQALLALPAVQHPQAFFNCWTRKEAYIKAQGQGLSLPLDQFDVSLTPGEPAQLLAARHKAASPAANSALYRNGVLYRNWTLFHLEPAPGYASALAVPGQGWQLQTFNVFC